MTKKRDEWNRLEGEKAKMIKDVDKQIAQLKSEHNSLSKKVQEKRDLQRYHKSMAQASTPPKFDVVTSPPTQNNPSSLQQRNVVTPIGINPYDKPANRYATKPPPARVQPTGGSSAIFDASKHEKESTLNAPAPNVQEKQQEKHEDAAQDLNEFFDNNHTKEEEEDMLLATMNSSEKVQYMWETYGKEEEYDEEDILTDGHSNGKEWQNEEAELAAKAEHDRKTAFASQDPTKSTVAAEVTTVGRKRTRKKSRKVKEMEDDASQGVIIKKEKIEIELQNLV